MKNFFFDNYYYLCFDSDYKRYPFFKFTSIYNYIVDVYFNSTKFQEEILERQKLENTPKLIFLNRYFELSNKEFNQVALEYINDLENDRVNTLNQLIQITERLFYFAHKNLINKSEEQIKEIFKITIKRQYKNNKWFNLNNRFRIINDYLITSETKNNNKNYRYIISFSKRVKKLLSKKQRCNDASQLIDLLEEGWQDYRYKFNRLYPASPIFDCLEINKLFLVLIKLENFEIARFTKCIKDRYEASNIRDDLSIEYQNLKQLSDLLKNYIEQHSNNKKLSHHLLTELYEEIDRACEKLQSQQKI